MLSNIKTALSLYSYKIFKMIGTLSVVQLQFTASVNMTLSHQIQQIHWSTSHMYTWIIFEKVNNFLGKEESDLICKFSLTWLYIYIYIMYSSPPIVLVVKWKTKNTTLSELFQNLIEKIPHCLNCSKI